MQARTRPIPIHCLALWMIALLSAPSAHAAEAARIPNPIGRLARLFDAQLVKAEDRVTWLEGRVSTLATHREHPLKSGLGYRGGRARAGDPDPTVVLDLGAEYEIDSIYLVPAQRGFQDDPGAFPSRFTLDLANKEDFSDRTVLYASPDSGAEINDGSPVPFRAHDRARYVRLTVKKGHNRGTLDTFELSEFAVISKGNPVSFGAKVSATGALDSPGIWFPAALTDGRTPLGIWHNGGRPDSSPGDVVQVDRLDETVSWNVELQRETPLDRLVLFPYQPDRTFDSAAFPDSLSIRLVRADGTSDPEPIRWINPLPGSTCATPLVLPLHGAPAKSIRIDSDRPCVMGALKMHGLAEIEAWSGGENRAAGLAVTRTHNGVDSLVTSLTDGFSAEKRIMPFAIWLEQLYERSRFEHELETLRPVHRQLASESELNATWGSAVVLGLTFLIPVFIVERRRLMSRDQLDYLRKRIASDLHDDIGSNLGSISLIARTARKDLVRLHGPEEIADDLGEVESIARESSLAMRDIVWLLERRQDSIGDLVQRMRETAGRLLREIEYTLECDSTKTAAKLSLDAKRHLFLFYKEAIHNVLKHSHAGKVSIRLWDEDDKLALEILDNGIGLPVRDDRAPTSVRKLEDRARVLDGLLQIVSSQETGTHIRLLVKRSHLNTHPNLA